MMYTLMTMHFYWAKLVLMFGGLKTVIGIVL